MDYSHFKNFDIYIIFTEQLNRTRFFTPKSGGNKLKQSGENMPRKFNCRKNNLTKQKNYQVKKLVI